MKFVRRVFDSDHVFTPPLATISGKLLGRSVFFLNFYLPVWKIIVEEIKLLYEIHDDFYYFFCTQKNYSISAHVALFLSSPVRFLHPPKTR